VGPGRNVTVARSDRARRGCSNHNFCCSRSAAASAASALPQQSPLAGPGPGPDEQRPGRASSAVTVTVTVATAATDSDLGYSAQFTEGTVSMIPISDSGSATDSESCQEGPRWNHAEPESRPSA
jgi:hypothetical protein